MIHNKHIFKFLANTAFVLVFVTSTAQSTFDFFKKLQESTTIKVTTKCGLEMWNTTPPRDL